VLICMEEINLNGNRRLEKYRKYSSWRYSKNTKISYEGLDDDTEQDIFLHIACFFKGYYRNYVEEILDACDLNAGCGISNLIDKFLVTVDKIISFRCMTWYSKWVGKLFEQESNKMWRT
jgi:hypothetical protein